MTNHTEEHLKAQASRTAMCLLDRHPSKSQSYFVYERSLMSGRNPRNSARWMLRMSRAFGTCLVSFLTYFSFERKRLKCNNRILEYTTHPPTSFIFVCSVTLLTGCSRLYHTAAVNPDNRHTERRDKNYSRKIGNCLSLFFFSPDPLLCL